MIGSAKLGPMNKNGTDGVENQQRPPESKLHAARPPPKKPAAEERERRRDHCSGEIERMVGEWLEQDRQRNNEIIQRSSCMRCRASGKVFEFVMANDQSRMFGAQSDASHSRITIGVGEINISADKHVLIIRAARRQNQETQNRKFDSNRGVAKHPLISNPQSQIRNPKLRPAR